MGHFRGQWLLILQHRHPGQDFVAWNNPIHRDGMTVTRWTDQAKRSGAASTAHNLNITAFNDLAAGEAITLVVERTPFPVAIKPLQHLEFICAGKFDGSEQWHRDEHDY